MGQLTLVKETMLPVELQYRDSRHETLPHVCHMSGGRSSAMMTLELARNGQLNPNRGDVVLFANTSAEHPATYDFSTLVCDEIESYGIPCFWYEFCTVETFTRRRWVRQGVYRLVQRHKSRPYDNPAAPGYSDDGKVFEELISWRKQMPNRRSRSCTQHLKMRPGALLLEEWFSGSEGPRHAGHEEGGVFHVDYPQGCVGEPQYAYRECPPQRVSQLWSDFSVVSNAPVQEGSGIWGLWKSKFYEYVSILGLRYDEPKRVARMQEDSLFSEGANGYKCRNRFHPPGEYKYTPLSTSYVTVHDVNKFWRGQPYDLRVNGRSNCVYCFMKGAKEIDRLHKEPDEEAEVGKPSDISWWVDIENKYANPSQQFDDGGKFGFLGLTTTYERVRDGNLGAIHQKDNVPCACTD